MTMFCQHHDENTILLHHAHIYIYIFFLITVIEMKNIRVFGELFTYFVVHRKLMITKHLLDTINVVRSLGFNFSTFDRNVAGCLSVRTTNVTDDCDRTHNITRHIIDDYDGVYYNIFTYVRRRAIRHHITVRPLRLRCSKID